MRLIAPKRVATSIRCSLAARRSVLPYQSSLVRRRFAEVPHHASDKSDNQQSDAGARHVDEQDSGLDRLDPVDLSADGLAVEHGKGKGDEERADESDTGEKNAARAVSDDSMLESAEARRQVLVARARIAAVEDLRVFAEEADKPLCGLSCVASKPQRDIR